MTIVVQCERFEGDLERQHHAVVKIREQTQMFDQYVVKNRHSLKLRYTQYGAIKNSRIKNQPSDFGLMWLASQ